MQPQSGRSKLILIGLAVAIVVAVIVVVAVLAARKPSSKSSDNSPSAVAAAHQAVIARRQSLTRILSALQADAKAHNNFFAYRQSASGVITQALGSMPIEPRTQHAFILQDSAPTDFNQIMYVRQAVCTPNNYWPVRTNLSSNLALVVKDELQRYFCLSSKVNAAK